MTRIEKLAGNLPQDIDAAVVTSTINRYYYTGLHTTYGILLVTKQNAYLLVDFRYIEVARRTVKDAEVILITSEQEQLAELVERHSLKTIGTENSYVSLSDVMKLRTRLAPAQLLEDSRVDELILRQRRYKTADEVERMQYAQNITDRTFTHILEHIRVGMTEQEISLEMEFFMRKNGAEGVAFPNIVVSGENSSLPHGVPGNRDVRAGDFITMDFGAAYGGYCSDMTRTVAIGEVSDEQRRVYDTVLRAQTETLAALKAGARCSDIDRVARDIIYSAGYEGCFGHGLGHSVGIEVHEEPRCSSVSTDYLEAGVTMTVEPGVYLGGKFGCRIEDMVLIKEDGVYNFTHSPKELIQLKG